MGDPSPITPAPAAVTAVEPTVSSVAVAFSLIEQAARLIATVDPAAIAERMIEVDHYPRQFTMFGARSVVQHVGKKAAGRLLDGREHNGMPPPQENRT